MAAGAGRGQAVSTPKNKRGKQVMTAADHEINRLRAQVKGYERVIRDLQEALTETRRHLWLAESRAKANEVAWEVASTLARALFNQHRAELQAFTAAHPGKLMARLIAMNPWVSDPATPLTPTRDR